MAEAWRHRLNLEGVTIGPDASLLQQRLASAVHSPRIANLPNGMLWCMAVPLFFNHYNRAL